MTRLLALASACALLASCQTVTEPCLISVADLPLKSERLPSMGIQHAPARAHTRYLLFDTNSGRERQARLGDYFFVRWYDANPNEPVRIVMHYTQALTRSQRLERSVDYKEPRDESAERVATFFFNGDERKRCGDILSWKVELYCGGKLRDVKRSYLWREPNFAPPIVPETEVTRAVPADAVTEGGEAAGEGSDAAPSPHSGTTPPKSVVPAGQVSADDHSLGA